jgi:hypothetical protein
LDKIAEFQQKVNIFLKNLIVEKRTKSDVWSPEILEKLFKATLIEQLSNLSTKTIKKLF